MGRESLLRRMLEELVEIRRALRFLASEVDESVKRRAALEAEKPTRAEVIEDLFLRDP